MHRSGEDGPWTPCAHRLATSVTSYDQLGFFCISYSPPVLFIESPRHSANSTTTTLGVIVVGALSLSHQVCFLLLMLTNEISQMDLRSESLQN